MTGGTRIETDLSVLKWMVGSNVAVTLILLGSVLVLQARLGEVAGQVAQITRAIVH